MNKTTSTTAAGMRNYKPRRPGTTLEDVVTPKDRKMAEDQMREEKMMRDMDAAYEKSRTTGYKKGGSVSSRADGCAVRGKTRGAMR